MDTCAYDRAVERDARDPYDVLGIDPSASDDEVRAAFHRKAEIYHPDRYQDRPSDVRQEASKMMAELTEARDKIPRRRAARAGAMPSTPGGPSRPPGCKARWAGSRPPGTTRRWSRSSRWSRRTSWTAKPGRPATSSTTRSSTGSNTPSTAVAANEPLGRLTPVEYELAFATDRDAEAS